MRPCSERKNNMDENVKRLELESELRELKSELQANTSSIGDWKIVKALEYQLAGKEIPCDIMELSTNRQAIRDRINAIETELDKMK